MVGISAQCSGYPQNPQNHNKRFLRSTRLLSQERLRKSAASCKLGRRQLRQARPMAGWAAESKQTILAIHSGQVFSSEEVAFLKKYF
jgi:hypothetical protein